MIRNARDARASNLPTWVKLAVSPTPHRRGIYLLPQDSVTDCWSNRTSPDLTILGAEHFIRNNFIAHNLNGESIEEFVVHISTLVFVAVKRSQALEKLLT